VRRMVASDATIISGGRPRSARAQRVGRGDRHPRRLAAHCGGARAGVRRRRRQRRRRVYAGQRRLGLGPRAREPPLPAPIQNLYRVLRAGALPCDGGRGRRRQRRNNDDDSAGRRGRLRGRRVHVATQAPHPVPPRIFDAVQPAAAGQRRLDRDGDNDAGRLRAARGRRGGHRGRAVRAAGEYGEGAVGPPTGMSAPRRISKPVASAAGRSPAKRLTAGFNRRADLKVGAYVFLRMARGGLGDFN
jgi:hypothetical protein